MGASLKETATQSGSVATSAEQLVNSITEMSASIEQVTVNVQEPRPISAAHERLGDADHVASIQAAAATAQEMASNALQVSTSVVKSAAATKTISRDTEQLTSAVNETAAAIEEYVTLESMVSRATQTTWLPQPRRPRPSINEMAASIEEVGAMAEECRHCGRSEFDVVEQMHRSIQMVAASGPQYHRTSDVIGNKRRADGPVHGLGGGARAPG
jgi:methyl-accepting chemotaxis protein